MFSSDWEVCGFVVWCSSPIQTKFCLIVCWRNTWWQGRFVWHHTEIQEPLPEAGLPVHQNDGLSLHSVSTLEHAHDAFVLCECVLLNKFFFIRICGRNLMMSGISQKSVFLMMLNLHQMWQYFYSVVVVPLQQRCCRVTEMWRGNGRGQWNG